MKRSRLVQVKVLEAGKGLRRVAKDTLLPQGARLLVPKSVIQAAGSRRPAQAADSRYAAELEECGEMLRQRVLYCDDEILVLDKPAGLPVQGGQGASVSLDKAMASALRFGSKHLPRLVHRLDQETSGALVVARTPDAAAWLSAAFARKSAEAGLLKAAGAAKRSNSSKSGGETGRNGHHPASAVSTAGFPWVQRTYWAIVEASYPLAPEGTIREPLESKRGDANAEMHTAVTAYRTLAQKDGFAWLQLTPVTGRKHQLRLHCAQSLGMPIVGDKRYGTTRSEAQKQLLARMLPDDAAVVKGRLQLHARSITISRRGDPIHSSAKRGGQRMAAHGGASTAGNTDHHAGYVQYASSATSDTTVKQKSLSEGAIDVWAPIPPHMAVIFSLQGWLNIENMCNERNAPAWVGMDLQAGGPVTL